MTKIALFIPSLRGGGAENIFLNLSKGLLDKGYLVDLVLCQRKGEYLTKVDERVVVVDLQSDRLLYALLPLFSYLKEQRPKVLISGIFHVNIISLLAVLLSGLKTSIVVTEHNPFSITQKKLGLFKRFVTRMLIKLLYPYAKAVVTVSQGVRDDLIKNVGVKKNNIRVIYNPIDVFDIQKKSQDAPDHKWLKNKTVPVILGVGRLTDQKDFPTLLRAFAKVQRQIDARLIILGEGEKRESLEALVEDLRLEEVVDLPGFVKNPYSFMGAADVFVLSSIHEGLPTVLIEALACGTPVVSTDCPSGPSEILENGKYGSLVLMRDPEALSNSILSMLESHLPEKVLQERASFFSIDQAIGNYTKLIE